MPKIPQGNFDAAPSTNVQMARVEPVKAVNSKELRAMGQRGVQLANTWDNLTAKAEALGGVSEAEEELNVVTKELEQVAKGAQGGMFQGKDIAKYTQERLEGLQKKHLSKMTGNSEQIQMYDQLVASKMQTVMNDMTNLQSKQRMDFANTKVTGKADELFQKMEAGTFDPDKDMQDFNTYLNAANGILPAQQIAKIASATRKTLAINASRMIANEGWSPEVEQKVKNIQSKLGANLTEAEKLAAQNSFDKHRKQGLLVARSKAEAGFKDTLKTTDAVDTYVANRGKLESVLQTLQATGPLPYESPEEYKAKIDTLGSKMIAAEVATINGNVLVGANMEEDAALQQKLSQDVAAVKARLFGDRAPANAEMTQAIWREISARRQAVNSKGKGLSMFMESNPEYLQDLGSGDSTRVEKAMTLAQDFYDSNGVDSHNRTIVPTDMAVAVGKSMSQLSKGSADPTGALQLQLLKDVQTKFGQYSGKAISDIISMGGGSKSGATNVPATWTIANYVADDAMAMDILGANNRLDENKTRIGDKYKELTKAVQTSENLKGVTNGMLADNLNFMTGYAKSVESLAASYMATGDGKISASDAVERAEEKLGQFITFSKVGNNSVAVPTLALSANQMTKEDLDGALKGMTNFETLHKMDDNIAWDKMASRAPKSDLGKAIALIQQQPTAEAKGRVAQKLLGDNLVVVNNGDEETKAGLYIRTPTAMVPLIMKKPGRDGGKDKYAPYNVDMIEAIKKHRQATSDATPYGAQRGTF